MFNTILENIRSNKETYSKLTDTFSLEDGLAHRLVKTDFQDKDINFVDFKNMSIIHANEIVKGFRFYIKLDAIYSIDNGEEVFTFALDCSSNKSFNNLTITDIKMK